MTRVDTASFISVTEASRLGVSALIRAAENGQDKTVLRNNEPVAVVMGFRHFEEQQRQIEDMEDIALTATRILTASPHRSSLDEILDRYGFTREELLALAEDE